MSAGAAEPSPSGTVPAGPPSVSMLFLTFLRIALSGFGGALPFARRELVERHQWLGPTEFNDLLSICQLMPGPNICNMSICLGWRFGRLPGAVAAFTGLVVAPCIIGLTLMTLYLRYGQMPFISGALRGISAAAIGLFVALGAKMAYAERRSPHILVFAAVAFLAAGPLGFPLLAVILVLAPFSILAAWRWSR
ncbi:chromate transporter [Aquabacter cavernae]|uniref:chromate transporter n=1 Tax=Aquabacter cavernae TaxID=2496029 RepID=UPI0013DEE273|nr:chromate transporter [Aquabacter cavernae]